ncbi:uncharacterized protein [Parasteatoda tepidariorum]|uniref:uncharacterized protein n=1 Tax=Parasteatoda tepidariorum TaxID=114398 RepID=UPI0039BC4AF7
MKKYEEFCSCKYQESQDYDKDRVMTVTVNPCTFNLSENDEKCFSTFEIQNKNSYVMYFKLNFAGESGMMFKPTTGKIEPYSEIKIKGHHVRTVYAISKHQEVTVLMSRFPLDGTHSRQPEVVETYKNSITGNVNKPRIEYNNRYDPIYSEPTTSESDHYRYPWSTERNVFKRKECLEFLNETKSRLRSEIKKNNFSTIICPFDKDKTEETHVKFTNEEDPWNNKQTMLNQEKPSKEKTRDFNPNRSLATETSVSCKKCNRRISILAHQSEVDQKQMLASLNMEEMHMKLINVKEMSDSSSQNSVKSETSRTFSHPEVEQPSSNLSSESYKQVSEDTVSSCTYDAEEEYTDSDGSWHTATFEMPLRRMIIVQVIVQKNTD